MYKNAFLSFAAIVLAAVCPAYNAPEGKTIAGPYSSAMENANPLASDAGIPGFIGPSGRGVCPPGDNDEQPAYDPHENFVNPVFKGWASGYLNYIPAPAALQSFIGNEKYAYYGGVPSTWRKPLEALGSVTGDNFHVCVLGDLHAMQLAALDPNNVAFAANQALAFNDPYKIQPGQITLTFETPIQNGPGPDFSVFENGFISGGGAGVSGQIFAELAYVEVSTDGVVFVRFPSVSLTQPVAENGGTGAYGTVDPSQVYNLAGKHVNAYQRSWGTPFNLSVIANSPEVLSGKVDLNNIRYIRIVDIPGSGFFKDAAASVIDPNTIDPATGLGGTYYTQDHGIHDAWVTWGSGGFDLEAIGVIDQLYGDADSDGRVDMLDFVRLAARWKAYGNWPQGDFDENGYIDENDLLLITADWLYEVSRYPK